MNNVRTQNFDMMLKHGFLSRGGGGGHSNRSCICTRDQCQNFGQVAKVENSSSQRVKAKFSWSKWSKLVQRSTQGGCGLISFEVGQGVKVNFQVWSRG